MSSSLNLRNNNKLFLDWLWCVTENGFYINNQWWPGLCLDQEEAPKHFPKPNLHSKKVMVTVRWSAAQLIHYRFLSLGEAITSERSMLSKSMRCTENCNSCSQHWLTERAQFLSTTTLNSMSHNQHLKDEQTGLWSSASSAIFTWPLANRLPLLQAPRQLFAGKMPPVGSRKFFPRVRHILKHGFLCYMNKHTYLSLANICWF